MIVVRTGLAGWQALNVETGIVAALLGKRVWETAEIQAPSGAWTATIVAIWAG